MSTLQDNNSNVIAWLVPTARNTLADKATNLSANTANAISTSSSTYLSAQLSNLSGSKPQRAIQLSFAQEPLRPGSFVLGTDTNCCDVVLPKLPGISKQHCAISFDAQYRLILDDFSESGTQVWYDWESNGDQRDYSWILSSGVYETGFPAMFQRVIIDIHGVRFQLVVNDHSADWEGYKAKVDEFSQNSPGVDCLTASSAWECEQAWYTQQPLIQHIFVKAQGGEPLGDVYLWNTSRPWDPMVKASA
ncbi:hypothetical protein QQS21_005490 [Conoideocrella luteorostrata]|uniref:FHA domain-containing protein n=1 Tax=Conoideocrella luteorostrata TaxID=1105319 RepID=A0AAJ0CSC9_9HYPO|nr:hypothetical protein QQS21_005490 [Conoideocrella luteorostrata]